MGSYQQQQYRPARLAAKRQPRILIADDDRDAADGLAVLLGLSDYQTHAVYDGEQALDAAQAFGPDLVILDLGMPVLNGFDAARRLRQDPLCRSDLVLIALTGKTRAEDSAEVRLAGFDFHLPKPVDPGELCHLIEGVLSSRRGD
jgi:CheY-like chemotaxis protein